MSDRITEIENRLNAATPGPWWLDSDGDVCRPRLSSVDYIDTGGIRPDAEFIAHSPADVAYLLAELRKAQETVASEQRHWDAWEVLVNSGNLDEQFKRDFHRYVDDQISHEYMAYRLCSGGTFQPPCGHDDEVLVGEIERPACEHCNRDAVVDATGGAS